MTELAWAIIIYTICSYPSIKLSNGGTAFAVIGMIFILISTIKELFK